MGSVVSCICRWPLISDREQYLKGRVTGGSKKGDTTGGDLVYHAQYHSSVSALNRSGEELRREPNGECGGRPHLSCYCALNK